VVFRRWVERRLSEPSPTLRRAIARLAWRDDGEGRDPLASLRKAGWSLVEWRDHPTPWTHRAVDRVAALDSIVGGLIHLGPPSRVQQESGLFVLRRERAFAWSP
jgi:hypothetical protein